MTDSDNMIATGITKLFGHQWDDPMTSKEENELDQLAKSLVQQYGWDAVFQALTKYVHAYCFTPESAANAAHLMWEYWWSDTNTWAVPDPYEFLGYLYYRIGFLKASYDARCILDDLTTNILPAQGYQEADIYHHPYYAAEDDPKMIAAVIRWHERLAQGQPKDEPNKQGRE